MKRRSLKHPSKLTFGIGAGLIMTLLVGVVTYMATGTSLQKTATKPVAQLPLAAIVDGVNNSLVRRYTFLHAIHPATQTTVGYAPLGYNFQVALPTAANSLAYADERTSSEQAAYQSLSSTIGLINTYFVQHGFTTRPAENHSTGLLNSVYFYQRTDAVCQVTVYTQLAVTCTALPVIQAIAKQVLPLVRVYAAAAPNSGTPVIGSPTIQQSKTSGYTIAVLPIYNNRGETSAHFYRHSDEAWHLVDLTWYNDPHEDGDILPNCLYFESSTPVREAFAGQTCYDTTTKATRSIRS